MITIAYITARPNPEIRWFFDSLRRCSHLEKVGQIIIVDFFAQPCDSWEDSDVHRARVQLYTDAREFASITHHVPPKPNVWGGAHRLTPRNWWHMAAARNTALCYATGDFIAYLDDRCVLAPTWMDAVVEARDSKYVVCGTYEKRSGMTVTDGVITGTGTTTANDCRMDDATDPHRRRSCPGDWMFGCTFGLPLEWMLAVNGVDESWDSVSMEDTHFGKMLQNAGYPIFHDGRMKMIEDRTPAEVNPAYREHDMKRSSKERFPHDVDDKTHKLISKLWNNKRSAHDWNLDVVRRTVLAGAPFPIATTPTHDWFDQMPLSEMT